MPTSDLLPDVERSRVASEGGREIAVLDWGGEGPPALLHHANGFCAALWDGVARHLRPDFRVFAMDAMGHGDSSQPARLQDLTWPAMAEDLRRVATHVLDRTGESALALALGHSLGGALCIAVASGSTLFRRIVLVDPVVVPRLSAEAVAQHTGESELVRRSRRRRQAWSSRGEARDFFASKALFADWEPAALDLYVAHGLRAADGGAVRLKCSGELEARVFAGAHELDLFSLAEQVVVPTRLLCATRGSFPRASYEEIASRMANASVVDIEGGHLVPMEEPARVAEAVLTFCAQTAPVTRGVGGLPRERR